MHHVYQMQYHEDCYDYLSAPPTSFQLRCRLVDWKWLLLSTQSRYFVIWVLQQLRCLSRAITSSFCISRFLFSLQGHEKRYQVSTSPFFAALMPAEEPSLNFDEHCLPFIHVGFCKNFNQWRSTVRANYRDSFFSWSCGPLLERLEVRLHR